MEESRSTTSGNRTCSKTEFLATSIIISVEFCMGVNINGAGNGCCDHVLFKNGLHRQDIHHNEQI